VFIKVSKQGSTCGDHGCLLDLDQPGLQHGVPLSTYVRKYSNMKSAGRITDVAELPVLER